jgi:hypothetical protein
VTADRIREACAEKCAEFGEPPCYELDADVWAKEGPCADCLRYCGIETPEPLDPNAVVERLL